MADREIRQLPEVTSPSTGDWYLLQKASNNQTSKVSGANLIPADSVTDDELDYPRWWQEIGRTTLGVAGDTISVTGLPARKYLMILVSVVPTGGTIRPNIRFNNDTANNYSNRNSTNGAADTTSISQSAIQPVSAANQTQMLTAEILNISAQEKLLKATLTGNNIAGAANAPGRTEHIGKWANTAAQISRIDVFNDGAGDYAIGSEVIVLGHN